MKRSGRLFSLGIVLLTVLAVLIVFPTYRYDFNLFGRQFTGTLRGPDINIKLPWREAPIQKELKVWQGLDLQGGIQLAYEADMSGIDPADRTAKLEEVVHKIDRRVNQLGVTEPVIRTSIAGDVYRTIVELPGVGDVEEAKALIGQTAQLEFKELVPEEIPAEILEAGGDESDGLPQYIATYVEVGLTGDDFYRASADVDINPQSRTYNQPIVTFEFKREAAEEFSDLTERLSATGGVLAIFLDDELIFEGRTEHITDGRGQISGLGDAQEAKQLAIALNEGALPVPISIVSEKIVSPTLGQEAVDKSLIAGIIGIVAVSVLMVAYYLLPGVVAVMALMLYSIYLLALFKLIPVTLTLAGIAGFILSIGMAVDANILIFERFKEEMRAGRSLRTAMDIGFSRAWNSIRDSNVSSLITCAILFYFGSGTVRGFALTLALGIFVSMFTAITITRRLMAWVISSGKFDRVSWYGIRKES
jgi:preprotein translocase subunit SecD